MTIKQMSSPNEFPDFDARPPTMPPRQTGIGRSVRDDEDLQPAERHGRAIADIIADELERIHGA